MQRDVRAFSNNILNVDSFWSLAHVLGAIDAPYFSTGTAFRFSNTDYILCAWIIENATNHSYGYNLHQYITTPLGLTKTFDQATGTTVLAAMTRAWGEYGVTIIRASAPLR